MKKHLCFYSVTIIALSIAAFSLYAARSDAADKTGTTAGVHKTDYCVDCHGKLGNAAAIVGAWEKSVHGKSGKTCNMCHGGNREVNDSRLAKLKQYGYTGKPDKRMKLAFCGRKECHEVALQQFQRSPHYGSVMKTGEPGCTSCHGIHNIQRTSINIISDKTCSGCHPVDYSREIIASVFAIEKDIDELQKDIRFLEGKKANVTVEKEGLVKTRSLFHQLVHVFSRQDILFTRKVVELEIKSIKDDVSAKKNTVRRMELFFFFTLLFSLLTTLGIGVYIIVVLAKRKKTE